MGFSTKLSQVPLSDAGALGSGAPLFIMLQARAHRYYPLKRPMRSAFMLWGWQYASLELMGVVIGQRHLWSQWWLVEPSSWFCYDYK